jgi:hypothetical protein
MQKPHVKISYYRRFKKRLSSSVALFDRLLAYWGERRIVSLMGGLHSADMFM